MADDRKALLDFIRPRANVNVDSLSRQNPEPAKPSSSGEMFGHPTFLFFFLKRHGALSAVF